MAFLIVVGWATAGFACLNDSEFPGHEREFRSQYGEPEFSEPTPPPSSDYTQHFVYPKIRRTGASLLVGALLLTLYSRRPKG